MQRLLLLVVSVILITCSFPCNADQILKIVLPDSLVRQFPPNGGVNERPALFGFPPYGGSITGYLVYDVANGTACNGVRMLDPDTETDSIYVVDRGDCTFVRKVRNAERAGARAVLVVNNINQPNLPYMADDGSGAGVEIPSVLINLPEGLKIKNAITTDLVQVVMSWSLQNPDDRVELDIFMSSIIRDATFTSFKRNFGSVARKLGDRMLVEPFYYVINGTGRCTGPRLPCGNQCIMNGRYCAPDPEMDLNRGLTGAQVVTENLKQACIYRHLNRTNQTVLWWQYVEEFEAYCSTEHTLNDACTENILKGIGIDPIHVRNCLNHSGFYGNGSNWILDSQIKAANDRAIFILPTIYVNGMQYHGSTYCPPPISLDHCGIFQTICSGYADNTAPSVCLPQCIPCTPNCSLPCPIANCTACSPNCSLPCACPLCEPGCPPESPTCQSDRINQNSGGGGGMPVGGVIAIVIVSLVLAAGFTLWYVRRQQRKMKQDFDAMLQSYMPIEDGARRGLEDSQNQNLNTSIQDSDKL